MKLLAEGRRYRVIDDFLEPDDIAELRAATATLKFEEKPSVVDAYADGPSSRSRGAILRNDVHFEAGNDAAMPRVYHAILDELHKHSDMLGSAGTDWSVVGFSFWQYPKGSRLGWHNDVISGRRGEFVFFLHDMWHVSWGGELLLLDLDPDTIQMDTTGMSPFEAIEAKVAAAPACLTAITPMPNRLVLMHEGTLHCIQRVDRTATSLRRSMTGFVSTGAPRTHSRADNVERLNAMLGAR